MSLPPITTKPIHQPTDRWARLSNLINRLMNWFWNTTESAGKANTKPFDGIL